MKTTTTKTLTNAASAIGGEKALARTLDVSIELLRYWLNGVCEPPKRIHVAAADIAARRAVH
jgi:hypothetical protein